MFRVISVARRLGLDSLQTGRGRVPLRLTVDVISVARRLGLDSLQTGRGSVPLRLTVDVQSDQCCQTSGARFLADIVDRADC